MKSGRRSAPSWIAMGRSHSERIRNADGRINVWIPEMEEWIRGVEPEREAAALQGDETFPLVLMAGSHMDANANTLMRDPSWNKNRRACTLAMNPADAEALNLEDAQRVKVITEAGEVEIELEVRGSARPGHVVIPHGFGLEYEGEVHGVNVNRLTGSAHRDPLAGTPLHRYVPCRVEALGESKRN